MRTIHIAGYPVIIGSRCRQLCAWCGEKLIDDDLALTMAPMVAVTAFAEGSASNPGYWEVGVLVAREDMGGVISTSIVQHENGKDMPPGSCCHQHHSPLRLVPR
jgi:hypothetical protein